MTEISGHEYKTPITLEEWNALKKGDALKDAYGAIWTVGLGPLQDAPRHSYLFGLANGDEVVLTWQGNQILDEEEWAIVVELNHAAVTLVSA
jgi:hypothetical protein